MIIKSNNTDEASIIVALTVASMIVTLPDASL